jgi:hypothetical protein
MYELAIWRKVSLERQLIDYGTTDIEGISFDPERGVLVVHLVSPHTDGCGQRTALVFENVQEYEADWHFEEGYTRALIDGETLIGLDEYGSMIGMSYVIETDCREIRLTSAAEPTIWPFTKAA